MAVRMKTAKATYRSRILIQFLRLNWETCAA